MERYAMQKDFVSGTYRRPEGVARSTIARALHPDDQ
jgi:hypothetical protein